MGYKQKQIKNYEVRDLAALKGYAKATGREQSRSVYTHDFVRTQTATDTATEVQGTDGQTVAFRAKGVDGTSVYVYTAADAADDRGLSVTVVYYDHDGEQQTSTVTLDAADSSTEVEVADDFLGVISVTAAAAVHDELRLATTGGAAIYAVVEIGDTTNLLYLKQATDQVGTDGGATFTLVYQDVWGAEYTVTADLDAADTTTAVAVAGTEAFFRLVSLSADQILADGVYLVDGDGTVLGVVTNPDFQDAHSRQYVGYTTRRFLAAMSLQSIVSVKAATLTAHFVAKGKTLEETITIASSMEGGLTTIYPLIELAAGSDCYFKLIRSTAADAESRVYLTLLEV